MNSTSDNLDDESNVPHYSPEFVHTIADSLRALSEPSVVPIYVWQKPRFAQRGTGTLLRIAERSFLVTASHVLTQASKYELQLYVADDSVGTPFVPLRGKQSFVREDRIDVAVFELEPELVRQLSNRKFLRLVDMDFQDHVRDGLFVLFGYPCEWNLTDASLPYVGGQYLGLVTQQYNGPLRNDSYDPRFHLLLSADKSSSRPIDGSVRPLPAKFSGMSGAAIWKTYSERHSMSQWKPDFAKMVAIETMAYGDQHEIIRATHVGAILRVLHDSYPDLQTVLRLYLPAFINVTSRG